MVEGRTITDPTEYHRLRIAEALGFGTAGDPVDLMDRVCAALDWPELWLMRSRMIALRALLGDGDGIPEG